MSERISISGKGRELFFGDDDQTRPEVDAPNVDATQKATSRAGLPPSNPATMPPSAHSTMRAVQKPLDDSESLRNRLRDQLDDEHGLHYSYRFSRQEIEALRDTVYELEAKRGLRVTRNDVVRLGLEWIIDDYRARGRDSLLTQVMSGPWRRRR
jgi:hypothetical protein